MQIEFKCPRCGEILSAAVESVGADVRCPTCGHVLPVPEQSVKKVKEPPIIKSPFVWTFGFWKRRENLNPKLKSAYALRVFSLGLCLFGLVMMADGCVHISGDSAIRQTVLVLEKGLGASVVALSLILWALTRIILDE